MNNIEDLKPKRKEHYDSSPRYKKGKDLWGEDYAQNDARHCIIYNKAIDAYEKYHTAKIKSMVPSVLEMVDVLNKFTYKGESAFNKLIWRAETKQEIAQAIHALIERKGGKG